jgi:predicted transcriptional regulator
MESHNLQLTALETKVLETLINGLYAEPGFSDVDAKDLQSETGISTRSIRGVLSSLIQKGIIYIEATDSCDFYGKKNPVYQLIYLRREFWYLHPRWKEDMNEACYSYYR